MGLWFLIFFLTPIIEMYLLIRVGGYIGAWPTVGLVVLTAMAGVTLLRAQGLATLSRGMRRLEGGELPAREMAEGLLLAVTGVLLITPGFVTDTLGLLLLVPVVRGAVAQRMLDRVVVRPGPGAPGGSGWGEGVGWPGGSRSEDRAPRGGRSHSGDRHSGGDVIEGEFESHTEPDEGERGPNDRGPR